MGLETERETQSNSASFDAASYYGLGAAAEF
jgi:hypothetical protein